MARGWLLYVFILGMTCSTSWAQDTEDPVWANLDIQIYGFIKVDAAWDDSRTTPGNYVKWVNSESEPLNATDSVHVGHNDNEFNLTAKETRIGLRVNAPEMEGIHPSGRVEFDFYNDDTTGTVQSDNKGLLLLRHAYVQLDSVNSGWSLLAGQTSDVVSPLTPTTLNYSVLWWAGNIGYRRAQIRLTNITDLGNDMSLNVQGAVARTIGSTTTSSIGTETGSDAGIPTLQGRAALTFPALNGHNATVGLSGHYGQEEHDYFSGSAKQEAHVKTWSGCLDMSMGVYDNLTVKGELYTGANLSQYLGGIGHGVSGAGTAGVQAVRNAGGWIAGTMGPWDNWNFNLGYGLSKNTAGDLATSLTSPQRKTNSCYFGNAIYDMTKHASIGVEISRWVTEYQGSGNGSGKAWRGQLSFILRN